MHKNLKRNAIILVVIGLAIILSLFFYYNPLEHNFFPKCPIYTYTGTHCPGCGSQRAIHQILQGNLAEGFKHNLLILLLIAVLIYDVLIHFLNTFLNRNFSNLLHKPITTIVILFLVVAFWILRNINQYPFTLLAP